MRPLRGTPAAWRHRARVAAWLFAAALFGYPIIGNLVSLMQIDSRVLSIPFRLAVGLASLWIFLTLGRMRVDGWRLALLIVWLAFMLRLVYDAAFGGIGGADYALQFFVAGALLPALAIWKLDAFDPVAFARAVFIVAAVGCMTTLFGAYTGAFGEYDLTATTGRLSTVALNPVSLGYLAVSGLFAGVTYWRSAPARLRPVIAVVMLLLITVLSLTGSKGPALALLTGMLMWSARRRLLLRFLALVTPLGFVLLALDNVPLLQRILASDQDMSTLDRLVLIDDSIQQVIDYPWIGAAFVELKSGFYAHSIFLEAAMAFGVPLTAVLLTVMGRGIWLAWRLLRTRGDMVGLLYIQGVINSALAGSMFGAAVTWLSLIVLLGLAPRRRRRAPAVRPAPALAA